jgi:hypothetical protein
MLKNIIPTEVRAELPIKRKSERLRKVLDLPLT